MPQLYPLAQLVPTMLPEEATEQTGWRPVHVQQQPAAVSAGQRGSGKPERSTEPTEVHGSIAIVAPVQQRVADDGQALNGFPGAGVVADIARTCTPRGVSNPADTTFPRDHTDREAKGEMGSLQSCEVAETCQTFSATLSATLK